MWSCSLIQFTDLLYVLHIQEQQQQLIILIAPFHHHQDQCQVILLDSVLELR